MVTMNGETPAAVIMPTAGAAMDHNNMVHDDDDDGMSDGSSHAYDDGTDLMAATMQDEVTAQLAAAGIILHLDSRLKPTLIGFTHEFHLNIFCMKGPVGMAAAAAIASAKKRKRPHQFETNPSIRKRQQTRLLRKLRVSFHTLKSMITH